MKTCTILQCQSPHNTKYNTCPTCREVNRSIASANRNGFKQQVTNICLSHEDEKGCKKILEIINNQNKD